MRDLFDVIVAPVVTEKATTEMDAQNVYTFIVHPDANKAQIAEAVEAAWDVKVEDVRTAVYAGKARRSLMGQMNRTQKVGRRPSFKKAMVRLAEGDHIELYEMG
ncbi:MAG: 50S ribosomal protein L23 [Gemmatimonadales bacterium]|jgi:large subunit ribosomal protein L23|nr:MAG: 50S ribosomal protein L23 [Gemmatimonadales bacterium]